MEDTESSYSTALPITLDNNFLRVNVMSKWDYIRYSLTIALQIRLRIIICTDQRASCITTINPRPLRWSIVECLLRSRIAESSWCQQHYEGTSEATKGIDAVEYSLLQRNYSPLHCLMMVITRAARCLAKEAKGSSMKAMRKWSLVPRQASPVCARVVILSWSGW